MKKLLTALFALTATVCCVLFAAGCKNDGKKPEESIEGTYKLYSITDLNDNHSAIIGITYYLGDDYSYGTDTFTEDTLTLTVNADGTAVLTETDSSETYTSAGTLTENGDRYDFTVTVEDEGEMQTFTVPVTIKNGAATIITDDAIYVLKKPSANAAVKYAELAESDSLEKPQMPSGVEIPDAEGYNNIKHQIERAEVALYGERMDPENWTPLVRTDGASVNCLYGVYHRYESTVTDGGEVKTDVMENYSGLRYVNGGDGNTVARLNACNKYSDNDGNKTDLISVNVNGGAADAFVNGNLYLRTNDDWESFNHGKNVPAAVSALYRVTPQYSTVNPVYCLHELGDYLDYKYKGRPINQGEGYTVKKAELTFKADADRYFAEYAIETEYKNGSYTRVEKTDFILYMDAAAGLKAEDIKLQTASPENVENILYVDCDAAQLSAAVKAGNGLSLTLSGGATQGTVIPYIMSEDKWDSVDGVVTGDKIEFDAEELRQFVSALSPGDALALYVRYEYWQAPSNFATMLFSVTRIHFTVE